MNRFLAAVLVVLVANVGVWFAYKCYRAHLGIQYLIEVEKSHAASQNQSGPQ